MFKAYHKLLRFCLLIIFPFGGIGQTQPVPARPLSENDKQQILQNIANTSDWDRINEMKMMMSNFQTMAPYYQQQIDAILEHNRHTLNGMAVMQEDVLWLRYLQDLELRQKFGHQTAPTQAGIKASEQRWLNGKPPEPTPQEKRMMHFKEAMNKVASINRNMQNSGHYKTSEFKADMIRYQNVQNDLKSMLSQQKDLSLADAIYAQESAYGNLQLTYTEYKKIIAESAAFIGQWMREQGLNQNNQEAVHHAIQTFLGDSMKIKTNHLEGFGEVGHLHKPFMYDYIDYSAKEDYHNYFLTKTLATGTGQCHTLPLVYLVLAEALRVEAYLSIVPMHTFIKYRNNDGTIQNYETTVHWHMDNQDYMDDMPISTEAVENRIYLDTLNKQQIVAVVMLGLAEGFMREHWIKDGKFVNECINQAAPFFNNGESSDQILILRSLLLTSILDKALSDAKIKDLSEIDKSPTAVKVYDEYRKNEARIEELGLQNFPSSSYEAMLKKHDRRGKLQAAKGINTKAKRTLFLN